MATTNTYMINFRQKYELIYLVNQLLRWNDCFTVLSPDYSTSHPYGVNLKCDPDTLDFHYDHLKKHCIPCLIYDVTTGAYNELYEIK